MAAHGDSYGYDQVGDKQLGISGEPNLPPYTQQPVPQVVCPPLQLQGYPPSQQSQPSVSNTTVVVQQPQQLRSVGPREWSSGICSCCDNIAICLCGAFCACCLAKEVAEDMGEHCCVPCCVPGWLTALRLKMRTQENISGTLMNDCCTVACCGPCALCQLAREVNVVKQRRTVVM